MTQALKTKGRTLTYALRHAPQEFGITLEDGAWADVNDVLHGIDLTLHELDTIVAADNKGRFSFNDNGTQIRANQGHSVKVDLQLIAKKPPITLYHGTVKKFWQWIKIDGIKKMSRHHVHLSEGLETAIQVASRRTTENVIIRVDTEQMYKDGIEFFKSENGVWLTDYVDPKYLKV